MIAYFAANPDMLFIIGADVIVGLLVLIGAIFFPVR